jgi:hypothetical protein
VKTLCIEPDNPWENGYVESFNGKLRDELPDGEIFHTLREARILSERRRVHYNRVRTLGEGHDFIGNDSSTDIERVLSAKKATEARTIFAGETIMVGNCGNIETRSIDLPWRCQVKVGLDTQFWKTFRMLATLRTHRIVRSAVICLPRAFFMDRVPGSSRH